MTTDERLDQLIEQVTEVRVDVGQILARQTDIKRTVETLEKRVTTVERFAHRAAGALAFVVIAWPFVAPYISGTK
jgi:prefoldin subunit 5